MADEDLFNIDFNNLGGGNDLDKIIISDEQVQVVDSNEQKPKDEKKSDLLTVDTPVSKEEQEQSEKEIKVDNPNPKQKGSLLSPLAAAVKEQGILPNLDIDAYNAIEDEKKADYLLEQMDAEIDNAIDAYKKSLSPQGEKYLTMLENGISEEQAYNITAGQIRYKDIDEAKLKDNAAMQEKIVYDYYRLTTRFSDEKIKGIIDDKKATSELEKEAVSNLPEIQKIYANAEKEALAVAEENKVQNQKLAEANLEKLKTNIFATKEIIPGLALTKKDHEKLLEYATKPVGYTQDNQPITLVQSKYMEDPDLVSMQLNYLASQGLIGKNADWSKVLGVKKVNAVALLKESIKEGAQSGSGIQANRNLADNDNQEQDAGNAFKGFPGLTI